MSKALVFVFFMFSTLFCLAQKQPIIYKISFPSGFPTENKADILQLLTDATESKWVSAVSSTEIDLGYVLQLDTTSLYTNIESYHLISNGKSLLSVLSSTLDGLLFGIYKHLRSLGFKFYLPDELYTVVPSLKNPFGPRQNTFDQPFVQVRTFFGTGGLGSGKTDPDKSVEKSWQLWKLRNGFGAAYQLAGHRGENFILENKETLAQHPNWLASPLYSNGKLDVGTKLNYQDKDAVDFFTDWSIRPFTRPGFKIPPKYVTQFVSLEPSDAGGYLNERFPQKKFPSISDQVYGAANQAAHKLDQLFPNNPNLGVNLYAYSSHAEPPSFELNPRVYVQLVPYQFQNIAFGPSFIQLWAKKVKRFGIYDYFRYPDAQYDLPGGLTLEELMKRLVFEIKAGAEGVTFETSYSKFSTGIPLWIVGRYLADGDPNWQKNLNGLINDLFSKSNTPVQKVFELFYNRPQFDMSSLNEAVQLTAAALQTAKDEDVQKRISELDLYLNFVALVLTSRDVTESSLQDRLVPVARFAWQAYETKIIDSYRIMQLVSYSFLNTNKAAPDYMLYQKLHKAWFPETDKNTSAWAKLPQFDREKKPADRISFKKKKINTISHPPGSPAVTSSVSAVIDHLSSRYQPKRTFIIGGSSVSRGYFSVYTEKPTAIHIHYKLTNSTSLPKAVISGIDKDYTRPLTYTIDAPKGDLKFTIPAGETSIFINAGGKTLYRLQIEVENGVVYFNGSPRTVMAFYKNFGDPKNTYDPDYYPSYVFFPVGITPVDYKVQLNNLQIYSPAGKQFESTLIQTQHGGFEIRRLSIPKQETGKLWKTVINGNFNYNFITIPDRYYLLEEK